jgi:hypothetical protein
MKKKKNFNPEDMKIKEKIDKNNYYYSRFKRKGYQSWELKKGF